MVAAGLQLGPSSILTEAAKLQIVRKYSDYILLNCRTNDYSVYDQFYLL